MAGRLLMGTGYVATRWADSADVAATIDLTGDRDIEWSWVAAHIPDNAGKVLDFGCGPGYLGLIAARKGNVVTGLDLQKIRLPYSVSCLTIQRGDLLTFDFRDTQFDVIINCSSIEHVGLAGRYGNKDSSEGDIEAMRLLRRLAKPNGKMILTIPVGQDATFAPLHRIYGAKRLPRLLEGWSTEKVEYWLKDGYNRWIMVEEQEALNRKPQRACYGLGLFLLYNSPEPSTK